MGCDVSKSVEVKETRKVIAENSQKRSNGTHDRKKSPLTDMQVDIINSTWPIIAQDKTKNGVAVFMDIFSVEPAIKDAFNFQGKTVDEAIVDDRFRRHASKFMIFFDKVCTNLDEILSHGYDCPAVKDLLLLGAHHATIVGFDFVYFNIFTKCLHLTWERELREEYTEEVRDTWGALFDFIISKIKEGYLLYMEAGEKAVNSNIIHEDSEPDDIS